MIGNLAVVLMVTALAPTPCANLKSLSLPNTTISGQFGEIFGPEHSAGLTTPARQLLSSCRSTPPQRGGE